MIVDTAIVVEIGNVNSVVGATVNRSDAEVGGAALVVWYWYWPESVGSSELLLVVAPPESDDGVMGRALLEVTLLEVVGRCVAVTTTAEVDSLLMVAPYPDAWSVEKTGSALLISVGEEESGVLERDTDEPTVKVMVTVGSALKGFVMELGLAEEMSGVGEVPGLEEAVARTLPCNELVVSDGCTV